MSIAGADEGHGAGSGIDATPAVAVAGNNPTSGYLTGDYNHQVPLPVHAPTGALVSLQASAIAWAPNNFSAPNQRVVGRLLGWTAGGVLICASTNKNWGPAASASNQLLGSCTFDPSQARAEAEFYLGNTNGQPKISYPRAISVGYTY